jgi:predicted ArsR family transcriptional regulator
MNPGAQHRRIMAYLDARIMGATDEEMALDLGIPTNSFRPRRQELVRMGKVKASDHQRLTFSGHPATVWVACDEAPGEPAPRSKAKAVAQAAAPFVAKAEQILQAHAAERRDLIVPVYMTLSACRALVQAAGEP